MCCQGIGEAPTRLHRLVVVQYLGMGFGNWENSLLPVPPYAIPRSWSLVEAFCPLQRVEAGLKTGSSPVEMVELRTFKETKASFLKNRLRDVQGSTRATKKPAEFISLESFLQCFILLS